MARHRKIQEVAPLDMTADLNERQLDAALDRIYDVFFPRPHWHAHDLAGFYREKLLFELNQLHRAGALKWCLELIPAHRYDEVPLWRLDRRLADLHRPALNRRGRSTELRDETWSAYRHLQSLHPRSRLLPCFNGLPYCYIHERTASVVTAGNIEPGNMMRFMLARDLRNLGIVSYATTDRGAPADWALLSDDHYTMQWLHFDPEALAHLKAFLDAQSALPRETAAFTVAWFVAMTEGPEAGRAVLEQGLNASGPAERVGES